MLSSEKVRDVFLVSICPIYKMASEPLAFSDVLGFRGGGGGGVPSLEALGPASPGDWQGRVDTPRGLMMPSQVTSGLRAGTVVLWR